MVLFHMIAVGIALIVSLAISVQFNGFLKKFFSFIIFTPILYFGVVLIVCA